MQAFKATRFFSLALLLAAFVGCGGTSSPPTRTSTAAHTAKAEPVVPQVQGRWTMSQRGDALVAHERIPMTVEINGTHVLGTYASCKGRFDGELEGNVVEGTWEETDGNGNFRWVLAPDGKSFQGTFGGMLHSQQVPEGATWSGRHK